MKSKNIITILGLLLLVLLYSCDIDSSDNTIIDDDTNDLIDDGGSDEVDNRVFLLSSTLGDVITSTLGMWDTKTEFETIQDDTHGSVLRVHYDQTSTQSAEWGTVIAFSDIDSSVDFIAEYSELSFKIKSDDFSSIFVYASGTELEHNLTDGESLGDGWYEMTISLGMYMAASEQQVAIFAKAQGEFYITDVAFSGSSLTDISGTAGYLYSPDNTQSITFTDLSPWDSQSQLTPTTGTDYGTAMHVHSGTAWGPTQCFALMGVAEAQEVDYSILYDNLEFKIQVSGVSTIRVYAKTIDMTFNLSDAESLGNNWYNFSIPFTDFTGDVSYDGQIAFLVDADFYITDITLN